MLERTRCLTEPSQLQCRDVAADYAAYPVLAHYLTMPVNSQGLRLTIPPGERSSRYSVDHQQNLGVVQRCPDININECSSNKWLDPYGLSGRIAQ